MRASQFARAPLSDVIFGSQPCQDTKEFRLSRLKANVPRFRERNTLPYHRSQLYNPLTCIGLQGVYFPVINAANSIHNHRVLHDINEKHMILACVQFVIISDGVAATS